MNFRTTLVIGILLIATAGAYFLFFQEPNDKVSINEKPPLREVYNIERDSVQQVELVFSDAAYQNLKLVKDTTGNWGLKAPFQADADTEKLNQMLDDILNKRVKHTLEVPELTQYGLDTPSITLSLWTDATAPTATFLIGKKAINYSVYIKEKSEPHIFLIESSALDDLTKAPTDLRDRAVVNFNPETVSTLQFKHGSVGSAPPSSTLNCEKREGTWHITHPIEAKADAEEIETLLSELRLLQVATFEADAAAATTPAKLKQYGLDTPRIHVTFTDGDSTHTLDIGSDVPPENRGQGRVYVKSVVTRQPLGVSPESVGADPNVSNPHKTDRGPLTADRHALYTVSDNIYRLLNTSVFDLRDKRVIDFQRTATNRFTLSIKGQHDTVCTKNYDNTWELEGPTGKIKADAQAVDDLLFGVDSLEAVGFVDSPAPDLNAYGLSPPAIQIAFTQHGEENPALLRIGDSAEDGTVYVKAENSNQVVRVKRALIDKIALGTAGLRDKQVLSFHIDDAIRLTMHGADIKPFTCQRLGTNWRLTAPVKESANNAEINAILYELDTLMAAKFVADNAVSDSTTGFGQPHLQLTVELRNQKVYTLQIGKTDTSGHFYARLQHEPDLIFLLNAELVPKLKTTLTRLRPSEQGPP